MSDMPLLARLRAYPNLKEVADTAGVSYSSLHNFNNGVTKNLRIANAVKVTAALDQLERRNAGNKANMTFIRVAEGKKAMRDDRAAVFQPFNRELLEKITPAPKEDLLLVFVESEGMEPTLKKDDQVLVDTTATRVNDDGVYWIDAGAGENVFRRCSIDFESRQIMVQSDNQLYKNARLTDPRKLKIVGKAIWFGRFI